MAPFLKLAQGRRSIFCCLVFLIFFDYVIVSLPQYGDKNMADIMLEEMDLKELKKLRNDVDRAIETFEQRKLNEARDVLEEEARKLGVSLDAIMGVTKKSKKRSSSPAKYHHPEDPGQTWTGKGRKPKWFTEALQNGLSPEDMEIS